MRNALCVALGVLSTTLALAQSSPFVSEIVDRALANEISGDRAFEVERLSTQWHKPSGSEGFFAVTALVEERARAAGLADVRRIDQVGLTASWTPKRAEAWLLEGGGSAVRETLLGSFADAKTSIADYS